MKKKYLARALLVQLEQNCAQSINTCAKNKEKMKRIYRNFPHTVKPEVRYRSTD